MRSQHPAVFTLSILALAVAAGVWVAAPGGASTGVIPDIPSPVTDEQSPVPAVEIDSRDSLDLVIGNPDRSSGPREIVLRAVPVQRRETVLKPRCTAAAGMECLPRDADSPAIDPTDLRQWSEIKPAAAPAASSRRFWVPRRIDPGFTHSNFQPVLGTLVHQSSRVAVYLDESIADDVCARSTSRQIVLSLEAAIIPGVERLIGTLPDIDSDQRVTILVTPLLEQLGVTQTPLRAFVRGVDLDESCEAPVSNRADLIYLNSTRLDDTGLWPVLAHEIAHLATFALRYRSTGRLRDEDWLDEGLAHAVELEITGDWTNLQNRVQRFLGSPRSAPLALSDEDAALRWRDPACRGAAALFLHHLRDRFGPQVYLHLASRESRGCAQCALATGTTFAELFRDWSVSLCRDGIHCAADLSGGLTHLRPQRTPWRVNEPLRLTLDGSTFDCLHLDVPESDITAWRIEAQSSRGEAVQLTVIPHRDDEFAGQAADR